jgi:hypothetical protein
MISVYVDGCLIGVPFLALNPTSILVHKYMRPDVIHLVEKYVSNNMILERAGYPNSVRYSVAENRNLYNNVSTNWIFGRRDYVYDLSSM